MQVKRFWFARLVRRIGKFAIDVRSVSQIDRYIAHFQKYSLFDQVISGRSGDGCVPKGAGHLLPLLDDEALLNKRRSIRNIKPFQVCDFSWFSRKATGGQGQLHAILADRDAGAARGRGLKSRHDYIDQGQVDIKPDAQKHAN